MLFEDFYGNNPNYFLGVVEDRNDPIGLNRVRVRIFGVHSIDQSTLNTGDLPWCLVLMPTTSAGVSGIGASPHGLVEGSWVFGTFLDGEDKQQGLVIGSLMGNGRLPPDDPCGISNTSGNFSTDQLYEGGSVPPINIPGSEQRERIFNFFVQNGYTPEQAAGIIGNMMGEVGVSLNPDTNQKGGNGYGLVQWDDRKQAFFAWARAHGWDHRTTETQLAYVMKELNSTESRANKALKASSTPEQSALAFCLFERPYFYKKIGGTWRCDPTNGDMKTRMGYARDTYEKYGKRSSTPSSSSPNMNNQNISNNVSNLETEGNPTTENQNSFYNPCINPNIVESIPALESDIGDKTISNVTVASTNTPRDVKVNSDEVNLSASYLIRKDGSIEKLFGSGSLTSIVLEGGSTAFAGSVSSNKEVGPPYYSIAQRITLEKVMKLLKSKNPNIEFNQAGNLGFVLENIATTK